MTIQQERDNTTDCATLSCIYIISYKKMNILYVIVSITYISLILQGLVKIADYCHYEGIPIAIYVWLSMLFLTCGIMIPYYLFK